MPQAPMVPPPLPPAPAVVHMMMPPPPPVPGMVPIHVIPMGAPVPPPPPQAPAEYFPALVRTYVNAHGGGLSKFPGVSIRQSTVQGRMSYIVDGAGYNEATPVSPTMVLLSGIQAMLNMFKLFVSPLVVAMIAMMIDAENGIRDMTINDVMNTIVAMETDHGRSGIVLSSTVMSRVTALLQSPTLPLQAAAGGNVVMSCGLSGGRMRPPTQLGDGRMNGADSYLFIGGNGLWASFDYVDERWWYKPPFAPMQRLERDDHAAPVLAYVTELLAFKWVLFNTYDVANATTLRVLYVPMNPLPAFDHHHPLPAVAVLGALAPGLDLAQRVRAATMGVPHIPPQAYAVVGPPVAGYGGGGPAAGLPVGQGYAAAAPGYGAAPWGVGYPPGSGAGYPPGLLPSFFAPGHGGMHPAEPPRGRGRRGGTRHKDEDGLLAKRIQDLERQLDRRLVPIESAAARAGGGAAYGDGVGYDGEAYGGGSGRGGDYQSPWRAPRGGYGGGGGFRGRGRGGRGGRGGGGGRAGRGGAGYGR